ncbi:trub family pseudouridylate synthase-containing protein [Xylariomycetidae sp. FL2044]|nr:trub family pseudouridylate synthase-containing protein [Xylariomycetidae sp. FL2044]
MAASSSASVLDGVFGINKPMGMSSAQVIRDCQHHFNPSAFFKPMIEQEGAKRAQESNNKRKRRGFGKNDIRVKMGHGGTLDPLATGVLILGVGKGTKSLQSFLDCTKTYETVVVFGASTDTYDRVGKILKKTAYDHITRSKVEEALGSFRGTFKQMPPLYSALKMEGKPLYEYAREGKPLPREINTRDVDVTELELLEWYEPGTHSHRWPAEEATTFERNFAEQVWKLEQRQQMNGKKLSPEEEEEDTKARNEHENFKRKADESVDALVYDRVNKRRKGNQNIPLMSGALGPHPPAAPKPGKGSNLIPSLPDPNTPPPWEDKGPPAARIRMTVTSGFYVRSFCHDLGVKVGSAAMMAELCRSRQGDFVLGSSNCMEFTDLGKGEGVWAPKMEDMLDQWNNKPQETPSHSARRAKHNQPQPTTEFIPINSAPQESNPSEKTDPREPKSPGKKRSSPASKGLPTPNASSPLRNAASEEAEKTDIKADKAADEGQLSEEATEQGVKAASTSQESSLKPDMGTKDADEVSWNGFPDTPASSKRDQAEG